MRELETFRFLERLLLPPSQALPTEMGLVGLVDEGVHFPGFSTLL